MRHPASRMIVQGALRNNNRERLDWHRWHRCSLPTTAIRNMYSGEIIDTLLLDIWRLFHRVTRNEAEYEARNLATRSLALREMSKKNPQKGGY